MDHRLLLAPTHRGHRAPKKRRWGSSGEQRLALCPDDEYEYAVTRVARAFGRDWFDQAAQPLCRTLYTLDRLEEVERIEGLVAEGQAITAALRTNLAFADGKGLKQEYDAWDASTKRLPGTPVGTLDDAAKADIARVFASWQRQPAEVS